MNNIIQQTGINTFQLIDNGLEMRLTWDDMLGTWVMHTYGRRYRAKHFVTLQQVEKKFPQWWGISFLATNAVGVMQ